LLGEDGGQQCRNRALLALGKLSDGIELAFELGRRAALGAARRDG
jgi:hypothetical protein